MSAFRILVDSRSVTRRLDEIARRAGDLRPALRRLVDRIRESSFKGRNPETGVGWRGLDADTIEDRRNEGSGTRPLFRTGRLQRSIEGRTPDSIEKATPFGLIVGTSVPYAIFHDTGTREMPARPFLGLPRRDEEAAARSLRDYITGGRS